MDWECCWIRDEIAPGECPCIAEGEEGLLLLRQRRIVEKCPDCPRFAEDLRRAREAGNPLAVIIPELLSECLEQRSRLEALSGFLSSKTREIKFLHELNTVLQTSLDLDEVLSVAMTAITAGKGIGLNRAFLLMADKERRNLQGYLGVGPRDAAEAWRIWQEIGRDNLTLKEMARNFRTTKLSSEKVKFQDILQRLTVPLDRHDHILNRVLRDRRSVFIQDAYHHPGVDQELVRILGVDSFLAIPLIARNRRIGVIVADNCITHKPITPQDIKTLETFAFPVAFAVERASLYERLKEEIGKLIAANQKLREQQELIVRMEKMALVGRVTSSIAHSIRNPLTVIGGFARGLLKNDGTPETRREVLETIVSKSRQLENVLEEVLNYSDSLYPVIDAWDANKLVLAVRGDLEELLARRNVVCTLELDEGLPPVFIDYRQIAYCLKSLITTVLEMRPGDEDLTIRTSSDGDRVFVILADSGKYLATEDIETLNAPFSEILELGVGLGLPLCRMILERNGIPFALESSPETGTRYSICLPTRKEE